MTDASTTTPRNAKARLFRSNKNMELLLCFIGIVAFSCAAMIVFFSIKLPEIDTRLTPFHLSPTAQKANLQRKAFDPKLLEGKERYLDILKEMDIDPMSFDEDTWRQVPSWEVVENLYGDKPIVHGLETCQAFREHTPAEEIRVAAAGMFNSGTNAIAILLQHNCQIPARVKKKGVRKGHGMEWQVPWGKHTPAKYRLEHTLKPGKPGSDPPKDYVLPVVSIRDPFMWMKSMCKLPYTARWNHGRRCPNLVNRENKPNKLVLKRVAGGKEVNYGSLAHLWNDWYREYYSNATYPRLLVRFEDLIFYPKETTEIVCGCAGGILMANDFGKVTPGKFQYLIQSSKKGPAHGKVEERTNLMSAWIKYGKPFQWQDFDKEDIEYARNVLDKEMMQRFRYPEPPV